MPQDKLTNKGRYVRSKESLKDFEGCKEMEMNVYVLAKLKMF